MPHIYIEYHFLTKIVNSFWEISWADGKFLGKTPAAEAIAAC